jgi:phage I-like protein
VCKIRYFTDADRTQILDTEFIKDLYTNEKTMKPTTRAAIEAQIDTLRSEVAAIKKQGSYYLDAWISNSKPSGKKQSYPRVQSRIRQFGGKKVRHIRQNESVATFAARCYRGQRIGKLQKAIDRLEEKLMADER